ILLVEDNEMNRDMLSRRLRRAGYEVAVAVDAEQGLVEVQSSRPDLVVMDLRLPDLTGWEAVRILKSDPQTAAMPILALTAHAMEGDRERALAAGCDDYDVKPVELPRVLEKIERLLAEAGSRGAGTQQDLGGGSTLPAG